MLQQPRSSRFGITDAATIARPSEQRLPSQRRVRFEWEARSWSASVGGSSTFWSETFPASSTPRSQRCASWASRGSHRWLSPRGGRGQCARRFCDHVKEGSSAARLPAARGLRSDSPAARLGAPGLRCRAALSVGAIVERLTVRSQRGRRCLVDHMARHGRVPAWNAARCTTRGPRQPPLHRWLDAGLDSLGARPLLRQGKQPPEAVPAVLSQVVQTITLKSAFRDVRVRDRAGATDTRWVRSAWLPS